MNQADIIRRLDALELQAYRLYGAVKTLRLELTREIDPQFRRNDLGLKPEDDHEEAHRRVPSNA